MLTPVRAVSNTDISFNNYTNQQQGGAASTMTPGSGASGNPVPQENTNLGRASVLALSGQLQLSQSVTVLAEALGRMLNIPRKDAESVDDYVNRLVQTIRGLSSSEREALNEQLTKVLQGLTLKMIAEVLKNPAGPDAARLAVILEMTRYKGDLAAKAVVSSYRQNTGNDLLAALPVRDQAPAQAQQTTQPRPAVMQGPPRQAEAAEAKTLIAEQAQKGSSLLAAAYAEETIDDAKATVRQPAAAGLISGATAQAKQDATAQTAGVKQDAAMASVAPASNDESPIDEAGSETPVRNVSEPAAAKAEKPVSEASGGREDRSVQRPHVDGRSAEQAKNAETGGKPGDYKPGLTKTDLENILLTSLAAQKLPQRAQGTSSYPAAISQMLESAPTDAAKQSFAANAAGLAAAAASSEPETPLPNVRNAAEVSSHGALSTEAKTAFEQPLLQSALASLTKEGLGMPFVANPQAKDEADSSSPPRGRWPSSSDEGEEGQQEDAEAHDQQPQDEQADGDEQHGPSAEDADNANGQGAEAGDIENAEAYYLRMGGFA